VRAFAFLQVCYFLRFVVAFLAVFLGFFASFRGFAFPFAICFAYPPKKKDTRNYESTHLSKSS
jgi:hypothetical protein